MVRTLFKAGQLKEVLHILNQRAIWAESTTYIPLLQECIKLKDLAVGKQVHIHILRSGLKPSIFLLNTLVNMYSKCGSVVDARQVFDKMPERDMITWNIMIAGYTQHGCGREALEIYKQMQEERLAPNKVTFTSILNACAGLGALEMGKEVHADFINARIVLDVILETALMDMYAKCGSMKDARQVFDSMAIRNIVSWNAMIAGYAQHGCRREAFEIYEKMQQEGMTPNRVTFICVLNACASLGALEKGKEVHANIIKAGIAPNLILETALTDMYAKCGSMTEARRVFDNMAHQDVVSWNVMIAGYGQHGCDREAFQLYSQMTSKGVPPDKVTFICALNVSASLRALDKGKEVHAQISKSGIVSDIILGNTLVGMYAKCGSIDSARQVFDSMVEQDVVSWNTMITGYTQHGCGREAFEIYEQMQHKGVTANKVTFLCVLSACASLGALKKGKQIHADISKSQIAADIILENTLLDMYAKCGSMKDARQVYDKMAQQNVVSGNAMIAGYAQHGYGREALQLFEQLQAEGLKPDSISFVSVLCACSHAGLVDEGHYYFDSMSRDYGISPTLEHFGCMVDLLGRAGRLDEAEDFVNNMPMTPSASVWGALLGACKIHDDVEVAGRAAKCLLKSDPQNAGSYVLLSNNYAAAGRWDKKANVRKTEDRGPRKEPGSSCIEVDNQVHTLVVEHQLHPRTQAIHAELKRMCG